MLIKVPRTVLAFGMLAAVMLMMVDADGAPSIQGTPVSSGLVSVAANGNVDIQLDMTGVDVVVAFAQSTESTGGSYTHRGATASVAGSAMTWVSDTPDPAGTFTSEMKNGPHYACEQIFYFANTGGLSGLQTVRLTNGARAVPRMVWTAIGYAGVDKTDPMVSGAYDAKFSSDTPSISLATVANSRVVFGGVQESGANITPTPTATELNAVGTTTSPENRSEVWDVASPANPQACSFSVAGGVAGVIGGIALRPSDTTPPDLAPTGGIVRADANPTNAALVNWTVTFTEPVTGVDAGDFNLVAGGGVTGVTDASIVVSGGPAVWNVAGGTGSGDGTLRLDLADNDSIRDLAGNPLGGTGTGTVYNGEVYTIDKTAPTSCSVVINGGDEWTTSDTVNLTLASTGATQMRFSNGVTWSPWEAVGTTKNGWLLIAGDGEKTVRAEFRDAALNVTQVTDSIKLDETPPTGSIELNGGALATRFLSVTVSVSPDSDYSGVTDMQFGSDGVTFGSWMPFAAVTNVSLNPGDGQKYVYARLRDAAGNVSVVVINDSIILDQTGPEGSVVIDGGAATTTDMTVDLTLDATDNFGTVDFMSISNNGVDWTRVAYATTYNDWTLAGPDGVNTVYVKFEDNLGNETDPPVTDDIVLDTAHPTGTMEINGGDTFTNDTTVSVVVTSSDPDVADIQLSNDGSAWGGWQAFGGAISWVVPTGDGVKTVYAQLRDGAGNVSEADITDTITLDQTPPEGSVVIAGDATAVNGLDVVLTLDATDPAPDSGVVQMRFSNDGAAWSTPEAYATTKNWLLAHGGTPPDPPVQGERTVYVEFQDGAGNWSSGGDATDVVTLDTEDPPAPTVTGDALTNDDAPTWSWTSNDPGLTAETTWQYQLDGGDWSAFSSDTSYTAAPLADGVHTLCVIERDAAGNTSEEDCFDTEVDTLGPNAPLVVGPVITRNLQPTWNWETGGGGGNGQFRVQLNGEAEGLWTETSQLAFTPDALLADKTTHTLYVQERDAAGNWSDSGSWPIEVDSDAVTAPSVTGITPTNDTTPEWTWTSGGGLEQYRYQFDAEDPAGWTETIETAYEHGVDLGEGTYTLYVQEKLSPVMWSQSGSFAITVDLTPPGPPAVDGPAVTNNPQPEWTWTSNTEFPGNGTFRYLLNCSLGGDWTETTDLAWTPLDPLADGTHTLCVQERDEAGNWSDSGTFDVTVDTALPEAPVVSVPAITSSLRPTWTWVSGGGGNGTYRYQLDSEAGDWTTTQNESFTPAVDLAEGMHTLYVQERDDAANWSASGSATVSIQPGAPEAPVVTSPPVTSNPQPTWSWVSGGGSGNFRYQFDSEAGDWTPTTDTTFTPDPLAEGLHTLYVQESSIADVWSASGSSSTLVDFTAPNPPVVTGPAVTPNPRPTWSWTCGGGDGNGTFRYQMNVETGDWTVTTATEFTPAEDLAAGVYRLYVQESDDAGNWSASGSWSIRVQLEGPEPPVVSGPAVTSKTRPAWTWVSGGGEGIGRFRYQLNSESGDWQLTTAIQHRPIEELADGAYTLYVQEQDRLGNWSASGSWTTVVDTVPPNPPIVSGVTPTRNTQPTWTWTPGGGGAGTFRVQLDSANDAWTVTNELSYTPSLPLDKNAHTLYAQEADAAGNWSVSTLYVIVIDPNAVNPPIVSGVTPTNDTTPTWTWESGGGGNGRYRYRLDGGDWVITEGMVFTPDTDLVEGSHILEVCESNQFGDWSWPGSLTIAIATGLPVITILGDNPVQVNAGAAYDDAGATAIDGEGADITDSIVTTGLPVDTNVIGTYYVRYNVTDGAGNRAPEAVRTVEVVSGVTEVALTSPATGSTLYMAAAGMPVLLALTSVAPEGTASVTYTFDDVEVGTATAAPWLVIVEITPDAAVFGEHTIGVAAVDAAKDSADSVTLTIAEIPEGSDLDANNIPDNPFTTLGPGDLWALDGVIVLREDAAATVPAGAPNMLALANPYNTVQRLIAAVSPSVLGTGETGVVILKASNSLETLLGAGEAALVADPPLGYAVAGSFYGTVNIAVTNNMVDYWNLDSSVLADFPVVVTTQDSLEVDIDLLVHEAEVMSGAEGVFIGIPTGAAWGNAGVVELNVVDGDATATLKALGLVAAFEVEGGEGEGEGEGEPPACFAANLQPPAPPTSGDGMLLMLVAALLLLAVKMRPRTARSIR